jgi:recombination associated protein RdgC
MLFRNLVLYRLPAAWNPSAAELEAALETRPLEPCRGFEMSSRGWVAPATDARKLYAAHGACLLALGVNEKVLPASIVREVTRERAAELEQAQGYPVGRRQMRDLKSSVTDELRARALTRRRVTRALVDPGAGLLWVDAASAKRAEEVVDTLRDTLGTFAATRLDTDRSASSAMTGWLMLGDAPGRFAVDQDLELKAIDGSKAAIRYASHGLDGKEIRSHIKAGKAATKLGLGFADRLSFVLNDKLELRQLALSDVITDARRQDEGDVDEQERFDSDFALATHELRELIGALIEVLGGERHGDATPDVDAAA